MVNAVCVVDLPKSICYEYDGLWFERKEDKMSWKDAYDACLQDGGNLVSVKSSRHLSFIAAMSHSDGSWIGAQYDVASHRAKWINSDFDDVYDFYGGWFNDQIPFDINVNRCIAIDPSGTTQNLHNYDCNEKKSFICEYQKMPQHCNDTTTYAYDEYTHEYEKVPPIEQCYSAGTSSLETLNAINEVDSKHSNEVLCDMGLEKSWADIACCQCQKDDQNFFSTKTLIITLSVTAFVFFFLFLLFFIYSLCYCLCSRKNCYSCRLFCTRSSCFKFGVSCFHNVFKRTDNKHDDKNANHQDNTITNKVDIKQIT